MSNCRPKICNMIKIRSIYNQEIFKSFQKFNLRKVFVLAYICSLLLLGVGILYAFLERSVYSVYILISILLPLSMHLFYRIKEFEIINRNIILKEGATQIFTFDEEYIDLEQISKDNTFKDRYAYKDIIRIIKYKKYYFLYINRAQALVVRNEDYVYGNEKDLDELFKKIKEENFIVHRSARRKKNIETPSR